MSEEPTTHNWKLQDSLWTCSACGHSFKWDPKKIPQTFASDGSPARSDPAWFSFQIHGLMSFIDAGKGLSEDKMRKLVQLSGMDPDKEGSHAAAFQYCFLEQEMDNLSFVDDIMEE